MPFSALLPDVTDAVDILGKFAENIKKAVESGLKIYDSIQLRRLQQSLSDNAKLMVDVNASKSKNIDDLTDYLDDNVFKLTWSELQNEWRKIAENLDKILLSISDVVAVTGVEHASDLKAALQRQAQIYKRLAELSEPQDETERAVARRVDDQLQVLRLKVLTLESSIDRYLRKFPP